MTDFQVLLTLMVTIWIFGKIFRALDLPVIFGELLGGIMVGPLVFGLVSPDSEVIKILAELGAFFLMLHAGLETDPKKLFHASKKSLLISVAGIAIPTIGGIFSREILGISFHRITIYRSGNVDGGDCDFGAIAQRLKNIGNKCCKYFHWRSGN